MNRRIVLIDQNETPNVASFYGIGLGNEIYTLQALTQMNPDDLRNFMMSLGKGDAIMLVGGEPFKFLQQFRHPGVRSENYFDCSKLYRLSWEGDLYTKIVLETPEPQEVQEFMSPDFTRDVDFSWFKSKIIHTLNDAHKFFDWLEKLPEDEYVSLDYEASGMTLDVWFELSGFSICNLEYGAFVSLTDLRHNSTQEDYAKFMERVGKYLDKKQDHIVCYNIQYEQSASHRMFGVYLYNLLDASVANVLDGEHYKKLSLKHTAQRVLMAKVWDTEFDWISDTIDSMLYMEEGKLKKDKHKVLKVTPETFEQTDEWKAICARYPGYIDEFKSLMLEYFGSPFMVIPSEILGKYCNLDAFYTLLIFETKRKEYSEDAIRTFMDNARLGAVLHNCGLYIDEPFRQEYSNYCRDMMAWGITTCAEARCYIKMEKHKKLMAKIDKYSDVAKKLLYANKFFNGDPIEITKYILTSNVDYLNTYELGLDEGKLLLEFGPDFAEQFIEKTREAMEEAEMIKLYKKTGKKILKRKIDDTVKGKKKLIQLLSQKIIPLIGLDKIKINNKHIELEKYLYYERAYNELMNISRTQLNDINNIYVLNNQSYEDENVFISGFTLPTNYYYNIEKHEDENALLETLQNNFNLVTNLPKKKYKVALIHSPILLSEKKVIEKLKEYDLILSGHMHNGLIPRILDKIIKNNYGLISPDKRFFAKNTRGKIKTKYYTIIITGGITKLSPSSTKILSKLNGLYPISINKITVKGEK